MLIQMIDMIFWVYLIMLFIRILGSWVEELQGLPLFHFIAFCTDPYLDLFRKVIPPLGMLDISPIIAFLCLGIFEGILKALAAAIGGG